MTKPASTGPDFTRYLDKAPTKLHEHYVEWLMTQTGFKPKSKEEMTKVVQLAVALYQTYQASPEAKQRRIDEKSAKTSAAARVAKPITEKKATGRTAAEVAERQAAVKPAPRRTPARKPAK